MYESHFALKNRPFGSKAEGAGVFVGPQQTKIMTSLKKGLVAADAIVTVTGPVGVGKTTIVSRALDSISPNRMVAWVGRMQLGADELLELLLAGFGVSRQSKGTIRRFAAFRRLLNERKAAGTQVAIVVEDALRIGVDALAELEALTAADTGDGSSANIILMGPPELNKLLTTPELARIHQRNRLRQSIDQFSASEINGYLKHCIREAGGEYDAIFDDGVADIVYRCSEGIPRIINTLCETALTTAAETGAQQVSLALMRQVAADAFGFEPDLVEVTPSVELANVETTPVVKPAAPVTKPESVAETEVQKPLPEVAVESGQHPNVTPVAEADLPAKEVTPTKIPETASSAIPELINDTNPGLKQLDAESIAADTDTEFDIESTQTQKRPAAFATDDPADSKNGEPDFDLDQALSPETDSTNLMPSLTPNLDQLAAEARMQDLKQKNPDQDADDDANCEPTENLPTLSDSMRVDVEVEVERARKADNVQATNTVAVAPPVAIPDIKPEPEPEPEAEPVAEIASAPPPDPEPEPEPAPVAESAPAPEPEPELESAPKTTPASLPEPETGTETESIAQPEAAPDLPAELSLEPDSAPEAAKKAAPAPELSVKEKKTKRIPDIGALEAALDSAKRGNFAAQPGNEPIANLKVDEKITAPDPEPESKEEPVANIPEITLDDELPQKKASDAELEKCALEIGNANSLEDISDFAAETIFGNEAFDEIAAAVSANPPVEEPSPVLLQDSEITAAANDSNDAMPVADSGPTDTTTPADMDAATKNRLAMVNALNNGIPTVSVPKSETIELGGDNPNAAATPAKPQGPQPEPIENQINTSMTQTLKALSAAKVTQAKAEEDEKPSGGLFSRFRRSS